MSPAPARRGFRPGTARVLAHAAGLAAFEAFALAGAAGDLAWVAGLELLPVLAAAEALTRLAGRRRADPRDSGEALRGAGAWVAGAWILGAAALMAVAGLSKAGAFAFAVYGLAPALGFLAALAWGSFGGDFGLPVVVSTLVPLAPPAAAAWGLGWGPGVWGVDLGLGLALAWLWVNLLARRFDDAADELGNAVERLAAGESDPGPLPEGAGALVRAGDKVRSAAARFARRGRLARLLPVSFSPEEFALWSAAGEEPRSLDVIAVVVVWTGAETAVAGLDPATRLAELGRFAAAVSSVLRSHGGTLMAREGGRVEGVWVSPAGGVPVDAPLAAARALGATLPVLASRWRQRQRNVGDLAWGVGLANGSGVAGAWGSEDARVWMLTSPARSAAESLARRGQGPWLALGIPGPLPAGYTAEERDGALFLHPEQ